MTLAGTSDRIYLDHNSTSPLRPGVVAAMQSALLEFQANPNSIHQQGQQSRAVLEAARQRIASALGVTAKELIFTASATEANFLASVGLFLARRKEKGERKIVISHPAEHASVSENLNFLVEELGATLMELPVHQDGSVALEKARALFSEHRDAIALTTCIGAHNETGILQPWRELSALAAEFEVPFHSDLLQCLGRVPLELKTPGLSTAAFGFHKIGGPKGIGMLLVRPCVKVEPVLRGGVQEKKRRAGTENVLGILGVDALLQELPALVSRFESATRPLRDRFEQSVAELFPSVRIVGKDAKFGRLPNTSYIVFPGIRSDSLLMKLDTKGVSASSGSACSSGMILPSRALLKMGFSEDDAVSAVRFSLGADTSHAQIDRVLEILRQVALKWAA